MSKQSTFQSALCAAALFCLAGANSADSGGSFEGSVEPDYVSSTLRRVEHFALFDDEGTPLGLVEWRERSVEGGLVLERDVFFAGGPLTIRHVERLTGDTQRLVWREVAPGVGRSQIVEPHGQDLVIVDWLRSGVERTALEGGHRARFPLALLEYLREGCRMPSAVSRYWPLTRSIEEVHIETRILDGSVGAGRRLVALLRSDGSCAGRFLFEGVELEGFQWQEGGSWARRVSASEHAELRKSFSNERLVEASSKSR